MRTTHSLLPGFCLATTLACLAAPADAQTTPATAATPSYAYATNGVLDDIQGRRGDQWKLLLDASNLGGKELDAAEVTLQAGTTVETHSHAAVEIIYVLSGIYEHEVNGKLYRLKAGMVGIVRPGDTVRHLVPKDGDAKLLILWTPGGESARILTQSKGRKLDPVPESQK